MFNTGEIIQLLKKGDGRSRDFQNIVLIKKNWKWETAYESGGSSGILWNSKEYREINEFVLNREE